MRYNHLTVNCFHCKKEFEQRKDTVKRQLGLYGHSCCKHCFGKENTFREARSRVMNENNPFKGKLHTEETKRVLSSLRIGNKAWNKGLTKETHPSVLLYTMKSKQYHLDNPKTGANNPNWKGGVHAKQVAYLKEVLGKWLAFRETILERDCHKCWRCEASKYLQVHHMASRNRYKEYEFDSDNCITLCKLCHREFHKRYGIKRFEGVDTINWLNEGRDLANKVFTC